MLIGCTDGVAADLLRQRRLGYVATEKAGLDAQLRSWLHTRESGGQIDVPAAKANEDLTRRHQSLRALTVIEEVTARETLRITRDEA